MNEHLINKERDLIIGKSVKYIPNDVVGQSYDSNFCFKNCVVVFTFFNKYGFVEYLKAVFYRQFNDFEFNKCDKCNNAYIIFLGNKEYRFVVKDINDSERMLSSK